MRKIKDLASPNEHELAQDGLEIEDEEDLAQVRGVAGLNIARVVAAIPNRVRTPDLNLSPVIARRLPPPSPSSSSSLPGFPPSPTPSDPSSGDVGGWHSPLSILDRHG